METEKKYFTLANRYINKLIKLYENDYFSISDLDRMELNFIKDEAVRTKSNEILAYKECFCFIMNYLVTITGLNKSELEEKGYINNYETIDVNEINNVYASYKSLAPEIIKEFEKDKIYSDKYDSIICLTDYDNLESDLFYNIRNALLHSEFCPHSDRNDYTVNIFDFKNTDYHKISGKLLTLTFQMFLIEYYSNVFATIASDINVFQLERLKNNKIENVKELKKELNIMKVFKVKNDYQNKINKELFKMINQKYANQKENEVTIEDLQQINAYFSDDDKKSIETEKANIMFLLIQKYYGNSFYKMNISEQKNCIYAAYNYLDNPKKSISEWLIHFYDIITAASGVEQSIKKFLGSNKWALKPALYMMKLYNCLYVMQNKSFGDIPLDKLNLPNNNVFYRENINGLFNLSFQKYKMKYNNLSNEGIYKLIYLEIIRNSLAHGKISFKYEQNNVGELEEIIIFVDKHKAKERMVSLKLVDVKKIIDSECFLSQNVRIKEVVDNARSI